MIVLLLAVSAGTGFALEWNPLDELLAPDGPIRSHIPFVSNHVKPSDLPRILVYSASRDTMVPARALVVPCAHKRAERETVERLTAEYGNAVAPMMQHLRLGRRTRPGEQPDPAAALLPAILSQHERVARFDPALLSRLAQLEINLVLVVEVPTYRQSWGKRSRTTEIEMCASAYECEGGRRLFQVREVARSGKSHLGETFEVVEARALGSLLAKTRDELEAQESEPRVAQEAAAGAVPAATGETQPRVPPLHHRGVAI